MCLSSSETLPCTVAAPRRAREFFLECVHEVFPAGSGASETVGDCLLVVSELMSNAVKAGCGTTRLTVEIHRDHVRIAADDDAPGLPQRVTVGPGSRDGRGLAIVENLSRAWGVNRQENGKQVWADIAVPSEMAFAIDCWL